MDYEDYIEKGKTLLQENDLISRQKALEYFVKAYESTLDDTFRKPVVLYFLAYGNLYLGQTERAYIIIHMAKRSIDTAIKHAAYTFEGIRDVLFEDVIDAMIDFFNLEFSNYKYEIDLNSEINLTKIQFY